MVAMVIGGVGNLRGAMIGGLMIGIIEVMNDAYFTASYRDIILFGLFFIFIVFVFDPSIQVSYPSRNVSKLVNFFINLGKSFQVI